MKAVTLRLDDEILALDALQVREILDLVPVTAVPGAPALVAGLINVRGSVVPLADLRVAFGMERRDPTPDSRIIVVEVPLDGEKVVTGLLADKVSDCTEIDERTIEEAPRIGMRWPPDYVRGIGKQGDTFIMIPEIGTILHAHISQPRAAAGAKLSEYGQGK